MARPQNKKPTDHELMILRILWHDSPLKVSEILERVPKKPRPSYSSLLTIVRIMTHKGFIQYKKQGKAFYYTPILQEEKHSKIQIQSLAETLFGGKPYDLAVNIIKKEQLNSEEINNLKKMLEDL